MPGTPIGQGKLIWQARAGEGGSFRGERVPTLAGGTLSLVQVLSGRPKRARATLTMSTLSRVLPSHRSRAVFAAALAYRRRFHQLFEDRYWGRCTVLLRVRDPPQPESLHPQCVIRLVVACGTTNCGMPAFNAWAKVPIAGRVAFLGGTGAVEAEAMLMPLGLISPITVRWS
jgi:hypothetical protein